MPASFAALCLALLLACLPCAYAQAAPQKDSSLAGLSPRQQELWSATVKKLSVTYAKKGLTPTPMSREEVDAIRVPLVNSGGKTGPLPWDVRLLLQFDRNLSIGFGEQDQLFKFLLDPKDRVFTPDGLVGLLQDISELLGDAGAMNTAAAKKGFLETGGRLPVVLSLAQLGGDEIPGLWLAEGSPCTPVVHFDYDDMPEFYLRSLCLLDYVTWYIDAEDNPESMNDKGTDKSFLLTPAEAKAAEKALLPQLEPLNKALSQCLEKGFLE